MPGSSGGFNVSLDFDDDYNKDSDEDDGAGEIGDEPVYPPVGIMKAEQLADFDLSPYTQQRVQIDVTASTTDHQVLPQLAELARRARDQRVKVNAVLHLFEEPTEPA